MNKPFHLSSKLLFSPWLAALAALVLLAPAAQATPYVVKLTQQGNKVVASGSGAIDLSDLGVVSKGGGAAPFMDPTGNGLAGPYFSSGSGSETIDTYAIDLASSSTMVPTSFGSGGQNHASSGSGDVVGAYAKYIWVPDGYVSGSPLANNAIWDDSSFTSLGVTPGTYTWKWGAGADQSFTLEALTAVPEPAVLGMFGCGLLLIGAFAARRRRGA